MKTEDVLIHIGTKTFSFLPCSPVSTGNIPCRIWTDIPLWSSLCKAPSLQSLTPTLDPFLWIILLLYKDFIAHFKTRWWWHHLSSGMVLSAVLFLRNRSLESQCFLRLPQSAGPLWWWAHLQSMETCDSHDIPRPKLSNQVIYFGSFPKFSLVTWVFPL